MNPRPAVLVVDLDGTLLRTDMLWETITELVRRKPHLLLLLPFVALGGKVALKRWLASHVCVDARYLPINEDVMKFIREAKSKGTPIILATASLRQWADAVAQHLGCFDAIIATEPVGTNISGLAKLERIQQYCNGTDFDYIGDRRVDIPIWRQARRMYVVGDNSYHHKLRKDFDGVFPNPTPKFRDWFTLLRIEQWSKNLLVFVPLVLAHRYSDVPALTMGTIAALALSLVASGLYILNDLIDLPGDRNHPTKSLRPLPHGTVSLQHAWILWPVLILIGITVSMVFLSSNTILLCLYGTLSLAYTLVVKRIPILDLVMLAGLYSLRVVIGGIVAAVELSPWLLGFAFMFFISLAYLKRHSELVLLRHYQLDPQKHRPYRTIDESLLMTVGVASAMMSLVILIMYLTNDRAQQLYTHPDLLWLIIPLMIYWIGRMWYRSNHGELAADPLSAALRDWQSLVIAVIMIVLIVIAAQ